MLLLPYLEQVPRTMQQCLKRSGDNFASIDRVIVFGSLARDPMIANMLARLLPATDLAITSERADDAVAVGLAKLARQRHATPGPRTTSAVEFSVVRWPDRVHSCRAPLLPADVASPAIIDCDSSPDPSIKDTFNCAFAWPIRARQLLGSLRLGPIRHPRRGYPYHVLVKQDASRIIEIVADDEITAERTRCYVGSSEHAASHGRRTQAVPRR